MAERLNAIFIVKCDASGAVLIPPQDGPGLHLVYSDPETGERRDGDGADCLTYQPDQTVLVRIKSTPEVIREMQTIGETNPDSNWVWLEDETTETQI